MTSVGFKKMNWFAKPSAYQQMEAARLKRRKMMDDFRASTAMLAAGFETAQAMQIQGVGELAAQNAQSRLQAKVKDMEERLSKQFESVSKLA